MRRNREANHSLDARNDNALQSRIQLRCVRREGLDGSIGERSSLAALRGNC